MGQPDRQNVTIVLPTATLKLARHQAVDANMSLSAYVARIVERAVSDRYRYESAKERQVSLMEEGLPLGFDRATWDRESLHDR